MDMKQGLICGLTGEKANFDESCPDFKRDESVKPVVVENQEPLLTNEIKRKLPVELYERLRLEQNLILALYAGLATGVAGAIIWAVISVATGYQIGYLAMGIGAMVGYIIRIIGKGIDSSFGVMGAAISLFSVLLGNFFSIIGVFANYQGMGYVETLQAFDYSYLGSLMAETFSPMDLLFYGLALYAGYKFSFRVITEKDLIQMKLAR
jgi:hypothetical protein